MKLYLSLLNTPIIATKTTHPKIIGIASLIMSATLYPVSKALGGSVSLISGVPNSIKFNKDIAVPIEPKIPITTNIKTIGASLLIRFSLRRIIRFYVFNVLQSWVFSVKVLLKDLASGSFSEKALPIMEVSQ